MHPYKSDGVDVEAGDDFSAFAGEICRESFGNNNLIEIFDTSQGHFRGPRTFRIANRPELSDCTMDLMCDGVGTKCILNVAAGREIDSAYDLVAMTGADGTRYGGKRVLLVNNLDVSFIGEKSSQTNIRARLLLRGLGNVCREERLVCWRGETAELGVCVASENEHAILKYLWSAAMLCLYHPDRMILGDEVSDGDYVIALKENGFRSNGISSVRRALQIAHSQARSFGGQQSDLDQPQRLNAAAVPSVLYDNFLEALNGWSTGTRRTPLSAIVHLSGGAFEGKLLRDILQPNGLSANLHDLFDPPPIMRQCAEWRDMTSRDCYETWNGGQGVLLIVKEQHVNDVLQTAVAFPHIKSRICGRVMKPIKSAKPSLAIVSKFGTDDVVFE